MDGVILINKEKEYTSHDVVAKLKKRLNIDKVGHTGTLDPNATGVLPILLGVGTKISKYLINHDKQYEVILKLGIKTDTADEEGEILETREVDNNILKEENIRKVLKSFIGKKEQIPPMYSAIKVNGKKLYEYARKGQTVEVPKREIEIRKIELDKTDEENRLIYFTVDCSKGTYIRTLCEDISESLGTIGYMKDLNRTKVGEFEIKDAVKIDEEEIEKHVIPIEELFKEKEQIELDNKKLELFLNGVKITLDRPEGLYRIYNNKIFIGLGVIVNKKLKRDMVSLCD